jgi:hypothetical protein
MAVRIVREEWTMGDVRTGERRRAEAQRWNGQDDDAVQRAILGGLTVLTGVGIGVSLACWLLP